jgi:uncharacterized membrane protein YfcA
MPTDMLLIALISFLIGLSKGGLGGPVLGAMIAPLLSQVMPVQQAVGITLPMLLTGDAIARVLARLGMALPAPFAAGGADQHLHRRRVAARAA